MKGRVSEKVINDAPGVLVFPFAPCMATSQRGLATSPMTKVSSLESLVSCWCALSPFLVIMETGGLLMMMPSCGMPHRKSSLANFVPGSPQYFDIGKEVPFWGWAMDLAKACQQPKWGFVGMDSRACTKAHPGLQVHLNVQKRGNSCSGLFSSKDVWTKGQTVLFLSKTREQALCERGFGFRSAEPVFRTR